MRRLRLQLAILISLAGSSGYAAEMATLELVAEGLDLPSNLAVTPDSRLVVTEKDTGLVRVIEDGKARAEPFLAISDLVVRREQGLLGIAFPPDSESAYVIYTANDHTLRLSRFALAPDGSKALAETEEVLLSIPDMSSDQHHYCGHLAFRDDDLYLCAGDMDDHGNPSGTVQDLKALQGKILRLDVSEHPVQPTVVAYGLRNPWHFAFDLQGNLLIPDVGWNSWEELNVVAGVAAEPANFGWPVAEGNDCRIGDCRDPSLSWPLLEWPHGGDSCAIIGGAVYDGERSPDWRGVYVFGDWCSGMFWALRDAVTDPMIRPIGAQWSFTSSISRGPDGELLLTSFVDGAIYRIIMPDDYEAGWTEVATLAEQLALKARRSGIHPSKHEFEQLKGSRKWGAVSWMFNLYDRIAAWW